MQFVLWVLMWKHLIVRMKRFIQTPLELFSPLVVFIILYIFKDKLNPVNKHRSVEGFTIHETDVIPLNQLESPIKIYYVPETDLTNLLMEKVAAKLRLKEQGQLYGAFRGYIPISDEKEIENILKTVSLDDAVIVFPDSLRNSSNIWPESLRYTIRMKTNFMTRNYKPWDGNLGSHRNFATTYNSFLRLQWAIDSTYLQLLTENDIDLRVSLQELPYAEAAENQIVAIIGQILVFLSWLSLQLVFVFLCSRLLEERTSGVQELIKMVGVSSNMLSLSHFLNVLPTGIIFSVVNSALLTASSNPLLPHTNPLMIAIMFLLFYVSLIGVAFALSYLVKNPQYIVSISSVVYIVLTFPSKWLLELAIPWWAMPFAMLVPHTPMLTFWKEMVALEQYGQGITISNMASTHGKNSVSVLGCYFFFVLQSVIFFSVARYLSLVMPGPYGQALPWTFICQKSYWSKTQIRPEDEIEELEEMRQEDAMFFEQPPRNAEVGIKIVNVSKVFDKKRVVNDVTMDIIKGEITVLLGHNGAGKTTLMSIITGMLSPTEGNVYVEGLDTYTQREQMRQHLGLCPQHNLFFPDLTVLEHVIFFTMLKGEGYREAKSSSIKLLDHLGLSTKLNEPSSALSGGMKRRLQLACALAGDAKLLVLDEPTAGLDVESRRQLWDLLSSLRGSRTVLLSTHFMEEADALGDRVAALQGGKLRCHATPMYLKRALGTGYRLTFTTIGLPREHAITEVIQSHIPDATLKETSLNSISYNLPAKDSTKFAKLFTALENKRGQLGIDSIGVGKSTLEEVFLKLCSDVTTTFDDDEVDSEIQEADYQKLTGMKLYLRQFTALFRRQLKFLWSKKISFILLQIILPIFFICGITHMSNNDKTVEEQNPPATMNLDMYQDLPNSRVLYKVDKSYSLRSLSDAYPKVDFEGADDVAANILRISKRDQLDYNKYIVGLELNETDAKILFTTRVRHAAPVAMNVLTNLLASHLLPWGDGVTLSTINYPLEAPQLRTAEIVEPKEMGNIFIWSAFIVFVIAATVMNAVGLVCKERESSTRHIHIMSGCSPLVYWLSSLISYVTLYTLVLVIPTLVACVALDRDETINNPDFLGTLFLIMFLSVVALLSFVYSVSFFFAERGSAAILIAFLFVFGLITPAIQSGAEFFEDSIPGYADILLTFVAYTMPPHTFAMAIKRAGNIARVNAYCDLNKDKCPSLIVPDSKFDVKKCCELNEKSLNYFSFEDTSPFIFVLIFIGQIIFYMSLVIAFEKGVFMCWIDRLFNSSYSPETSTNVDQMVCAEKCYVNKAIDLPSRDIRDAMLVDDIHKKYLHFPKPCVAVKGVSFSVQKGECFGLLGVNGAGKSTTFKMLTSSECPTRGRIFGNGYHMDKSRAEYLRSLGYCPQFFGFDEFLTGRENLTLLLTLQGRDEEHIHDEVASWIDTVGLEKYADQPVSGYSGGCARRLSTAASLCGNAAVTLLDEPTAGVDVAARRRVWAALRRATAVRRSLIITSHSMDEMEALCNRIAIMSAGEIRVLGEPAVLRANHAAGHALTLKLMPTSTTDETDGSKPDLMRLKAALQERFDCTLKDEHKSMLQYHINDEIPYSELFSALENLKQQNPLIEDYSVTETTLEEVFLSFAQAKPAPVQDSPA
ncbi:retinal-specific phospholipid-transporting ATPase ABCA4-like [Pieris brassicae]|uniref:retinal-specific phospholipid-transporting ATPase ABCA4-like n=1 Tax=Pieris brassicae TaxID=7116 RepID=UPI001E66214E|nr:retinal-specific phospholipid-transporting ATPase ABCA4-like [Pieris brassicae]